MCSCDCICTIFLFTIVLFISILMQNNNEITNKISNESSESSKSFYDSSNENEISNKTLNIHFVFMGDVSYSMKDSYDNNELQGKSSKIYDLLENTTKKLSLKNNTNVQVSGILFGTKGKERIADFISLTDFTCNMFNFYKYYNPKERLIELLESHGAISIKNFMYKEGISPTEEECNFFYNILKDDYYFTKKVVDSLPYQCKSKLYTFGKMGTEGTVNFLEGVTNVFNNVHPYLGYIPGIVSGKASKYYSKFEEVENDEIIKEINEKLKECLKYKIQETLNRFNWNKNYYETKSSKEVINSIELLKDNINKNIPNRTNSNIMDLFSDFIYRDTPLKTAMNKTIEILNKDLNDTIKIIIILSDGLSTDGDPNDLKYLLKDKNIYIISFYFSSEKVYNPKQLYYTKPDGDEGLVDLYNLASEIHPYSPIFDMLEERGWKIDYTKKNKLFVKANNIEIFEEFIDILNSFINGKNNILGEMISKIKINDYINFYNKKHRINENQKNLPICWSHALAKVIEYASHRIYRGNYLDKYPYPIFKDLKNDLIKEYKEESKLDEEITDILDKFLLQIFSSLFSL